MTCNIRYPSTLFARRLRPVRGARAGNQRGQATVEAGIVITLFVVLTMGIIEFGRMWMVGNMITQAAREGARAAALTPPSNRTSGDISASYKTGTIAPLVRSQIQNALDATTTNALTINVTQMNSSGVNEVEVQVTGSVPYIFNLPFVGSSRTFDRRVRFRDEGKA